MVILAVEWGTVGEWVSGLAAAGGLVFAGFEIAASRKEREAGERRRFKDEVEHREAMARAVGVQGVPNSTGIPNEYAVEYSVHNGGQYPIDNVVLIVTDPAAADARPKDQIGTAMELILGTVMPGQTLKDSVTVAFGAEPVFAELLGLVGLLFTDTFNQSWYRAPGVLEKTDHAPLVC